MSQFGFLHPDFPDLHDAAAHAEGAALSDPRACVFYARRALELAVAWLYKYDRRLTLPYQDNLAALLHEPTFRAAVGDAVFYKARYLKDAGNKAVHSPAPVSPGDALAALRELFHLMFWLARTYARGARPADALAFDPALLPRPMAAIAQLTLQHLRAREAELRARDGQLAEALAAGAALDAALLQARAEVAAARTANAAAPDRHDYDEDETRRRFIDLLLREAGWNPDAAGVREVPLIGMPAAGGNAQGDGRGEGRADYVLWGDDGLPLAVVEAKAAWHSALKGQQQAKLYADCLERAHGQRPVIFCTNGYEHWLWDDTRHPARQVQGFYKKGELALLVQRRAARTGLAAAQADRRIVERPYQHRAIARIGEAFEAHGQRRALVVMATGAGKTRTVIALCDLLMRCNWVKRALFLADRTALVRQAVNAFKAHLPGTPPVNLLTDPMAEGRVFVSTYPTMMGLIDTMQGGVRRFGAGHFDLVVVDEAHRSIYRKYAAIFDHFDGLLVGLTATPREEIDRNTYRLFELEDGVPTDAYGLDEAVRDGFLVPLRFQRDGITYDALPEAEREAWDATEWGEDGEVPDRVEPEAVNRWLFNADTVDKVLAHLMLHGQKVAGGDRLGKTIVFAKNQRHAEYVAERFGIAYPHLLGFARVISHDVDQAASLIEAFEQTDRAPYIAVSVDMLDTGIDVPDVVNLVFFKPVRSRTKFWQMVGRGTRLRPDLFGPGRPKTHFSVFDFCGNLEVFSQDVPADEGTVTESLGVRLFRARLDLIGALDGPAERTDADRALRVDLAGLLRAEVAAMDPDANFIVRPHRRLVERYAAPAAWAALDEAARAELAAAVAGLPSGLAAEKEEAKRLDLLALRLQLCVLDAAPGYDRLRRGLQEIASALEAQSSIPAIRAHLALLQELQTEAWWDGVTAAMLEGARVRLRGVVHLIEKGRAAVVYTDFEDREGEATEVVFGAFAGAGGFERFREKARHFLRDHRDHVAISKLRLNRPLTPTDLEELERMLCDAGVGTAEDVARAKADSAGLGLFVRSLVGLDPGAVQAEFAEFLGGRTLRPNQIEFVQMMIEHLTEHGVMDAGRLYEPPYTDLSARGIEGVFDDGDAGRIVSIVTSIQRRAAA